MGEAKLRKLSDPNYGKASKFQPGIIITPMIVAARNVMKIHNSNVSPVVLRSAILFYEKIVFPQARTMHFSGGEDVIMLEEQGIIQRMYFGKSGPMTADDLVTVYPSACREAFNYLESIEPGCWSVTSGLDGLIIWDDEEGTQQLGGLIARLYRSIPLPSSEMPIAEVLEFKHRRRDELGSLQAHIAGLSKEIYDAESPETEVVRAIKKIDQNCSDLIKVSREFPYSFNLSTVNVSFDLNVAGKMGLGFLAGYSAGLPLTTAAMASVASNIGSIINFSLGVGLRSQKWRSTPYNYIVQAHKEFKV